jgi:hypothetical protein
MTNETPDWVMERIKKANQEKLNHGKLVPGHEHVPLTQLEQQYLKEHPLQKMYQKQEAALLQVMRGW